ncbi:hypothetical protein HUG20_16785 [Salicibibacter cibi]|uniref:Pilus assembly protein Flp/PilA n=2 Tax=Bacillaceae TaxID=186817 RepID=A0A1G8QBP4_9BACI|nr:MULTISPECIES: hypothetical protein [Bacillaceae]QQK81401.1 hypothetical protein HUG20_16785 [Salicibibacter cibi]SDJ02131.1 hypothetical protein SAMN04488123_11163 [Natribacillus halophilus]
MKKLCQQTYVKLSSHLNNQKGAQSLEWLGIAAVIIILLGLLSTALSESGDTVGEIVDDILEQIQQMVGG